MLILVSFLVNAGLNFALGLAIAALLGAEAFGLFAIGSSIALLVNALGLYWLVHAATRFYSLGVSQTRPEVRRTLDGCFVLISGVIGVLALGLVIVRPSWGLPPLLIAASLLLGVAMALFDYAGALARAKFMDASYAKLVVAKNALALVAGSLTAFLTRDPALTVLSLAVAGIVGVLLCWRFLKDDHTVPASFAPSLVREFAVYGFPLVVAGVVYVVVPLIARAGLAAGYGLSEAGRFSLAYDIGIRVFAALGSGLDAALFPSIIRAEEKGGRTEGMARARRVALMIGLALMGAGALYALSLPLFEALVIPPDFRGAFHAYSLILIPALVAFAIMTNGLSALFRFAKRTGALTWAALGGLAVACIAFQPLSLWLGAPGYAWAVLAGLSTSFLVALTWAWRLFKI